MSLNIYAYILYFKPPPRAHNLREIISAWFCGHSALFISRLNVLIYESVQLGELSFSRGLSHGFTLPSFPEDTSAHWNALTLTSLGSPHYPSLENEDRQGIFISYRCWNELPPSEWLNTAHMNYLMILEIGSLKWVLQGWNQSVCRAAFLLEISGEDPFRCLF